MGPKRARSFRGHMRQLERQRKVIEKTPEQLTYEKPSLFYIYYAGEEGEVFSRYD